MGRDRFTVVLGRVVNRLLTMSEAEFNRLLAENTSDIARLNRALGGGEPFNPDEHGGTD